MNEEKPRVVFDTNVYISALNFGGVPERAFSLAFKRAIILLISPAIMTEVARVLREDFLWSQERITGALKKIARVSTILQPEIKLTVVSHDDDNRFLECALEGRAHLIVSGDQHLLSLRSFQGIVIIRPVDLVRSFFNEHETQNGY